MIAVTFLGETVPDRFMWAMAIAMILFVIEARAWFRMDRKEKDDRNDKEETK